MSLPRSLSLFSAQPPALRLLFHLFPQPNLSPPPRPSKTPQAAQLLKTVGFDERGFVCLDSFDTALGVPAAPPELPPQPNCCVRCVRHTRKFAFSGWGTSSKQPSTLKLQESGSDYGKSEGSDAPFELDHDEPRLMRHTNLDIASHV